MVLMIVERGWFQFVEQPNSTVINILQELYANTIKWVGHAVMVRGKPVAFATDTINEYFKIETPNGVQHKDRLLDLYKLIVRLFKPGRQWTTKAGMDLKVSFPYIALSKYGKAWYTFIWARLMPTRHQNDVFNDRARLLYGIVLHHLGRFSNPWLLLIIKLLKNADHRRGAFPSERRGIHHNLTPITISH